MQPEDLRLPPRSSLSTTASGSLGDRSGAPSRDGESPPSSPEGPSAGPLRHGLPPSPAPEAAAPGHPPRPSPSRPPPGPASRSLHTRRQRGGAAEPRRRHSNATAANRSRGRRQRRLSPPARWRTGSAGSRHGSPERYSSPSPPPP